MVRPKEPYPLQKVTLNLRVGDWRWLQAMHGRKGAGKAIREMVMQTVDAEDRRNDEPASKME